MSVLPLDIVSKLIKRMFNPSLANRIVNSVIRNQPKLKSFLRVPGNGCLQIDLKVLKTFPQAQRNLNVLAKEKCQMAQELFSSRATHDKELITDLQPIQASFQAYLNLLDDVGETRLSEVLLHAQEDLKKEELNCSTESCTAENLAVYTTTVEEFETFLAMRYGVFFLNSTVLLIFAVCFVVYLRSNNALTQQTLHGEEDFKKFVYEQLPKASSSGRGRDEDGDVAVNTAGPVNNTRNLYYWIASFLEKIKPADGKIPDLHVGVEQYLSIEDKKDFQERVLNSATPIFIVFFHTTLSGPCKILGPRLEALATEKKDKFHLAKVDVDNNPELAEANTVSIVPSVIFFKAGKSQGWFEGIRDKDELDAFANKLVGAE